MSRGKPTRRFIRRFLKDIAWIMSGELPYRGWYDFETDKISVIIDIFLKDLWRFYKSEKPGNFMVFLKKQFNFVFLHEYIHWMTEPADEDDVLWRFPPKMTTQQTTAWIEQMVDYVSGYMSGCHEGIVGGYYVEEMPSINGKKSKLYVVDLKSCVEGDCWKCDVRDWCVEEQVSSCIKKKCASCMIVPWCNKNGEKKEAD